MNKKLIILILSIFVISGCSSIHGYDHYKSTENKTTGQFKLDQTECENKIVSQVHKEFSVAGESFKEICKSIAYEDSMKNPWYQFGKNRLAFWASPVAKPIPNKDVYKRTYKACMSSAQEDLDECLKEHGWDTK